MAQTPSQTTHVLPGSPPVSVALRRNARARRYSLRVSRSDGRVSLSLPLWAPEAEALEFLRTREAWVRAHLAQAPEVKSVRIGADLPVAGRLRCVVAGEGRSARLDATGISVPAGPNVGLRVKALLKLLARDALAEAVERHARVIGRTPGRLSLRDTRSRWGSCSSRGDLMFSWRLIMAPGAVLDYVAAHEVAHLSEMNHSRAFWSVCGELCPGYKRHRDWLRDNGAGLLAWSFDHKDVQPPC